MALTVLVEPTQRYLTRQSTIAAELGIDPADPTSLNILQEMIRRASSAITRECGRPFFGAGRYQETLKGSGSQMLGLSCVPVLAVSQVLRDGEVLPAYNPTVGDNDSYAIEDPEAGVLYNPVGWGQTAALMSWGWQAYSSRYILPGGTSTLRYSVTYTAGYLLPDDTGFTLDDPTISTAPPSLPGAIEQACLVTVRSWWSARMRDPSISAVKTGEESETYGYTQAGKTLPVEALGLLRDYRRVA